MPVSNLLKGSLIIGTLIVSVLMWFFIGINENNLLFEVDAITQLPIFETSYLYFFLHLFIVIPVFALSFDKKVAFYKKWKYLFPSILIVGIYFIVWDVIFTQRGAWGFNERYLMGVNIAGLPFEEILFFITVPFACTFIYECTLAYFKRDLLIRFEQVVTPTLIILFALVAILHGTNIYTSSTFLLAAAVLSYHYIYLAAEKRSRFYMAYLISIIPFVLVNGVLTGGFTQSPVVVYNPAEYLGIRIGTIPLDDFVYSFTLLFMTVIGYEYFRAK